MRHLSQYNKYLSYLKPRILKTVEIHQKAELDNILGTNDKLVIACRHSTPLSWIPVILTLITELDDMGHGDRTPIGMVPGKLHQLPLIAKFAEYIAQDAPTDFDELVDVMQLYHRSDFVVFPEGSNCFFGDAKGVQPFVSTRFLELAVNLKIPVLLINHQGSEDWATSVDIGAQYSWAFDAFSDLLPSALAESQVLGIPKLPKPIEKFDVWFKLYLPRVQEEELLKNPDDTEELLREDALVVREFFASSKPED